MASIEAISIHKSYEAEPVLRGVRLEAHPGDVVGLLGPNGAGKTTLLLILCGWLQPDQGVVKINGRILDQESPRLRGLLGFSPQVAALYSELSVVDNLRFFAGLYGVSKSGIERHVDRALDTLSLGRYREKRVGVLSGGLKKRVSFAASLVHEPSILILDEPTAGVDSLFRTEILKTIHALSESGLTILFSSNRISDVEGISTQTIFIVDGEVKAAGKERDLLGKVPITLTIESKVLSQALMEELASYGELAIRRDQAVLKISSELGNATSTETLSKALSLLSKAAIHPNRFKVMTPSLRSLYEKVMGEEGNS